jgi:hypothetical protein
MRHETLSKSGTSDCTRHGHDIRIVAFLKVQPEAKQVIEASGPP